MSNLSLVVSDQATPPAPIVTSEQVELVKQTVAQNATNAELNLYLYDCQRHGVHPLDRLLHFTKRQGKYTPITSIDLLRSRAADTGELGGIEDPQYRGEPAGAGLDFTASVTVYRFVQGQRCPFTATARWTEYKPAEDFMWRKMPFLMLGKCAEALALRKAFPRQLAGLYAKEEMDQADNTGSSYTPPPRQQDAPARATVPQVLGPQAQAVAGGAPICDVCGTVGRPSKYQEGRFYCPNKEAHGGKSYTIPEAVDTSEWEEIDNPPAPQTDDLL